MVPINITIKFSKPPEASIRAWRQCMREAHVEQATYWFREFFPDHFTAQAHYKYGYKQRSDKYRQAKAAGAQLRGRFRRASVEPPGNIDNVFTGYMRDEMLHQQPEIRGFPTRGRITFQTPDYLQQRPRASNQPDKWAELARIVPTQSRQLDIVLSNSVHSRFANATQEPVTIRIAA